MEPIRPISPLTAILPVQPVGRLQPVSPLAQDTVTPASDRFEQRGPTDKAERRATGMNRVARAYQRPVPVVFSPAEEIMLERMAALDRRARVRETAPEQDVYTARPGRVRLLTA
jgi:hypothetical protein